MTTTTTNVLQIKLNLLTQQQYNDLQSINPTEFYAITDATMSYTDLSDKPSVFTGATGTVAGTSGFVPAPAAADNTKFLKGDGTWATVSGGGSSTLVDLTDTNITSPTNGQALVYDNTTSKWINSSVGIPTLTANKALISDNNGSVAASSVTNTELGYVSGVTSSIQTQLNNKIQYAVVITDYTA